MVCFFSTRESVAIVLNMHSYVLSVYELIVWAVIFTNKMWYCE